VLRSAENVHAAGLTPAALQGIDVVIDFTTPQAALENMRACLRHGKKMVVGTTGWYSSLSEIKQLAANNGGFVYASNFSIGVNIFFELACTASAALQAGYSGRILERHHSQKKDAPSGTALTIRSLLQPNLQQHPEEKLEITSVREGDTVGQHVILLDSLDDTIMLVHDAKSRRGYAEGAVRAAEWIATRQGFYEFREVLPHLKPAASHK